MKSFATMTLLMYSVFFVFFACGPSPEIGEAAQQYKVDIDAEALGCLDCLDIEGVLNAQFITGNPSDTMKVTLYMTDVSERALCLDLVQDIINEESLILGETRSGADEYKFVLERPINKELFWAGFRAKVFTFVKSRQRQAVLTKSI